MARIRKVEILNFRGIRSLSWLPSPGINCLIGPGDSCKSTVLDAIDLCLGARRNIQFSDADFFNLDVKQPIRICPTIGELGNALKNFDTYGLFLRGFDPATGEVEDDPEKELETVLTLTLTVQSDLEPACTLVSDRATAQNVTRNLTWADRVELSPTRIGALAESNLGWRRGSVLNRLTDEKADASAALVQAARDARDTFGDDAAPQLAETLRIVGEAAKELGIDVGAKVRALLDAHAATFAGGTISLHNEQGVPLRGLGIGSARLLIAGLQHKAAAQSSLVLVDELEHGLEPHRIIRFLGSLGAKEKTAPLQVFMTTHSPVALRELSGDQLFVLRETGGRHTVMIVGTDDGIQGTIRVYPDAFLAPSVLICEGASEVGLMRGLDQHFTAQGKTSLSAHGVALVDCTGDDSDRPFMRGDAFLKLGYRVAVLRDDDKKPTAGVEKAFTDAGGVAVSWRQDRALEDELFISLPDAAVTKMLDYAIELYGDSLIDDHVKSATQSTKMLASVQAEPHIGGSRLKRGPCSARPPAANKRAGSSLYPKWSTSPGRSLGQIFPGPKKASAPSSPGCSPGSPMSDAAIDLLAINRGTVTAPAGCGKTHLIAETLKRHDAVRPILILTHTNAGVAAVRGRLDKAGVPPRAYRLTTIDGWAIRLIGTFPARSEISPAILNLENPRNDYPAIRKAAAKMLKAGHVLDILAASYSRLIVDEYQDCSILQHALVYCATPAFPVCVLGDPMQAVFGWPGNELADWDKYVCAHFLLAGELTTPWRWKNANTETFGRWLLDVRRALKEGTPVDLRGAPPEVSWVNLDGSENRVRQLRAASIRAPDRDGTVLIIGKSTSPPSQQEFASQTPGAVTVEAVDLRDLVQFARELDFGRPDALVRVVSFAASVMTNLGAADLLRRVEVIGRGTARREPFDVERAALAFKAAPSPAATIQLLVEIGKDAGVRTHRLPCCGWGSRPCNPATGRKAKASMKPL